MTNAIILSMRFLRVAAITLAVLGLALLALAQSQPTGIPAPSAVFNIVHSYENFQGRPALRIEDANLNGGDNAERMAVMPHANLQDGTIDVDLAGDTAPNAAANLRGFVGIAFRVSPDASTFA